MKAPSARTSGTSILVPEPEITTESRRNPATRSTKLPTDNPADGLMSEFHPRPPSIGPSPVIVCRGISLGYDQELVLKCVDLEIEHGAFLPFVGPNGAGKTTLLRAILGLMPVREGAIETPFSTRPAGFVPQHQSIDVLFPVIARDIVLMGLFPRLGWWGRPTGADQALVDSLLARLHLYGHAKKAFHELSGGMRQKILIARALAAGSDVLVMDEPTASLDADSEQEVIHLLHELSVRDGKTVLFAQHSLDLVRHLTDKVCWVHRGQARVAAWQDLERERNQERHLGIDPGHDFKPEGAAGTASDRVKEATWLNL